MRQTARGFTLIELMVVIAIIGLVASMAAPSVTGLLTRARAAEVKTVLAGLSIAAKDAFMRNNSQWPGNQTLYTEFPYNPYIDVADFGFGAVGTCHIGPPKSWDATGAAMSDWKWLDYSPDGLLRARYNFAFKGDGTPSFPRVFHAIGASDLDGDGICAARLTYTELQENGNWWEKVVFVFGTDYAPVDEGEW